MRPDRRRFIRETLRAALGASVYSAFGNLKVLQAATSACPLGDYKALVCVFLYGGNDGFNVVTGAYSREGRHAPTSLNSHTPLSCVRAGLGEVGHLESYLIVRVRRDRVAQLQSRARAVRLCRPNVVALLAFRFSDDNRHASLSEAPATDAARRLPVAPASRAM